MPPCCLCRSSASCRPTIRGSSRPWRRSGASCPSQACCFATCRRTAAPSTDCRRARVCFCPAPSGSRRCWRCRGKRTRRGSCSSGCSISATTSGCWRRSTTPSAAGSSATSLRRSRTLPSSARRSPWRRAEACAFLRRLRRVRPQWLILAAGIAVTAGIRGWLASRVSTPWLFSDELIHSELAKNLANGSLFEIRGRHVNVTYAYPLVLAPAWLLPSLASTYAAAKAINIVLLAGAAIPVYLWGRKLVSPVGAAVAAVLVLLLPELALSSALMQENLAFPAFLVAVLALGLVLEAPTPGRQMFLIAATALAAAARFELLVLVAIIPTAIVFARASARRLAGVLVPTVGVIFAMIALAAARPSRLQDALQTFPETSAGYSVSGVLKWFVRSLAEL